MQAGLRRTLTRFYSIRENSAAGLPWRRLVQHKKKKNKDELFGNVQPHCCFSTAALKSPPCPACPFSEEKLSQDDHSSLTRCGSPIPQQKEPSNEETSVVAEEQQLPKPTYSVRRRILDMNTATPLNSSVGKERLVRAMANGTAATYFCLTQHAMNQSEPAYCGVTTAVIVLNALESDSVFRWKGGWRYWHESILLANCPCLHNVETNGITMDEFHRLMTCQNVKSNMKRADSDDDETEFRNAVRDICASEDSILVVSFARHALGQTGDGHFSPIAAYDADTDSILVLDVARYKYPYYWITIADMHSAMKHCDAETGKSRGWFRLTANARRSYVEERRPIHTAPLVNEDMHPCPIQPIKVEYCKNQTNER